MATTSTKKEIIDYLWDWASSNGNWAKLLVKEITDKERPLHEDERGIIYKLFLNSLGLMEIDKPEEILRPTLNLSEHNIKLKSLRAIKGVNRLAENQQLEFSNNITVIYGENGTGKTGYGRILKALGFSYEKSNNILPNVFSKIKVSQSATIAYSINEKDETFEWTGENKISKPLQNISVFNNNCVKLSLDAERELIVTPIGFHLFTLLSNELNQIEKLHIQLIKSYETTLPWLDKLKGGTKVSNFINSITHRTTLAELKSLAIFSEADESKLKKLQVQLKDLNKKLLEAEIKSLKSQQSELKNILKKAEFAKNNFTKEIWNQYKIDLNKLRNLERKGKGSLSETASKRGVELYDSEEFQNFIKAADEYIRALEKEEYPSNEKELCIYCLQELKSDNSRKLLTSYRKLLNDTTQQDIKKLKRTLNGIKNQINQIESELVLHQPSFGVDKDENAIQPQCIIDYNKALVFYKKLIEKDDNTEIQAKEFKYSFGKIESELNLKEKEISEGIESKNESLVSIKEKEKKLISNINELSDCELLSKKIETVEALIQNLKIVNKLETNSHYFNTGSVSRKTSDARKNLVADNFNEIFNAELKNLKRSSIEISLDFRTERGSSKLVQYIASQYEIPEILSEGEQKAIALAEFLTELRLDKVRAPVIFDDPVTSLDHYIIDEVAKRLVTLSEERQVIIFTHSILLFNCVKQKSESPAFKKLQYKYYETNKDTEFTGYLYDSPDLKQDTFSSYESRINQILNLPKEERTVKENELAIEGYNKLRAAIEILVEKDILCDSVKRYRRNIALTSLERVNGILIDTHKERLMAVFEKCCGFTDAHSSPDELVQKPNLEELKADLKEIKDIRKVFLPA